MPQIMAEAFARGLLDKIMVEVLDVVERDAEDGKSWEQDVNEETGDAQQEYVHALEKQVKCDVCNVDDAAPLTNPATDDVVEAQRTTRGQGDTHQIVHAATLESPTESVKLIRRKKEGEATNEATNVTRGLLQQLIEDLENKVSMRSEDATLESVSKERIAVWEEKQERFVRTIEDNADGRSETLTEFLRYYGDSIARFRAIERKHDEEELRSHSGLLRDCSFSSIGRSRVIELKHDEEELRSHSSQHVASTSREIGLEDVQIEKRGSNSLSSLKLSRDDGAKTVDQILPVDDAEKRKTFNEATTRKKKKKGFGSRLKKFFRTTFGRRKN
ncbi:PREDICTED: uncharacterized protein LOC105456536 isoform X2 [Wasmannia auropunctata]|uniref:uncharacterized protein LOC105456536 isoform X2 n=1 Tax=Wasmannia auropunctata TaxID=64793 RepID=UPI0005F0747A|nr:PREDICTED: uncharacterized protein LOC105456536 isoform X2 [Wasmannia auropunctata]